MTDKDRKCGYKSCNKTGKHLCSGCGEEIYCSKECQKSAWPSHKPACKMALKPEAAAFLKSLDALSIKQLKNVLKVKAATFEKKKRTIVLTKLENIIEKPQLVRFVQEYVAPSEVESLLTAPPPNKDNEMASSSSSSAKSKSKGSSSSSSRSGRRGITRNNHQPTPTPEQLRQQASMMKKNPGMVRKANPAFAKMTDAQIRQYAEQLEQAANNPEMMKEVTRMSKLSDSERNRLQRIQEGLSGSVPMDSKWMDDTIDALKTHPQMFKAMVQGKGAMMGGISDEQIGSFIDMLSRMDAWLLKLIFQSLQYLGSLYKPLTELYNTVDSYTFGGARYIAFALFAIVAYYFSVVVWIVLKFFIGKFMIIYNAMYSMVMGGTGGAADNVAAMGSAAVNSAAQSGSTVLEETIKSAGAATAAAGVAKTLHDNVADTSTAGNDAKDAEAADSEFEF